jgi:vacuolar-type H+-ATPase subunit I/STV1
MSAVAAHLYRVHFKEKYLSDVLVALHLTDMFEPVAPLFPIEAADLETAVEKLHQKKKQYQDALEVLQSVTDMHHSKMPKIVMTSQLLATVLKHRKELNSLVDVIITQKKQIDLLQKEILSLDEYLSLLEPIKQVQEPIFGNHSLLLVWPVIVPHSLVTKLGPKLHELATLSYTELPYTQDSSVLVLLFAPELETRITHLIERYDLELIIIPKEIRESSPVKAYRALAARKHEVEVALTGLLNDLKQQTKPYIRQIFVVHDLLALKIDALASLPYVGYNTGNENQRRLNNKQRQQLTAMTHQEESVVSHVKETDTYQIDGWLDPEMETDFSKKMKSLHTSVTVSKMDSADDPELRTVLKNSFLLRPFELITSLLGTPHPTETDPSPYVAPFFVLFFGFALGDAGYGILLSLLTVYLMSLYKQNRSLMNVLLLVLYCSLSTFVFGVLTGSWFGADLQAIGPLGNYLEQFKFLDLQANLIFVLVASLIIGFIHQLFGLILSAVNYIRLRDPLGALLDPLSWITLLGSIILMVLGSMGMLPPEWASFITPFTWFSLTFFAIGQGRGTKNWLLRPLVGLGKLFNLTGYISNTLSYARLLALALATNVIGSVVNLLTGMTAEIAFIGPVLAVFVFIGGHLFNIVLNVMGTFINVARLHLVEFFPRFFNAKGIALEPVHPRLTHTVLDNDFPIEHINLITNK